MPASVGRIATSQWVTSRRCLCGLLRISLDCLGSQSLRGLQPLFGCMLGDLKERAGTEAKQICRPAASDTVYLLLWKGIEDLGACSYLHDDIPRMRVACSVKAAARLKKESIKVSSRSSVIQGHEHKYDTKDIHRICNESNNQSYFSPLHGTLMHM